MMTKKIYGLRRAILLALFDFEAYQDLDTIACHHRVVALRPDPADLRREWRELQDAGFIEPLSGYGGAVCRLAAAERKVIDDTGMPSRDEKLWGYEVV